MNYWGYRIDVSTDKIRNYFFSELKENEILRQGWGWRDSQNLKNKVTDETAKGNLSIFNKVKKGDILLVPRLEGWDEVAIVEATDDFDKGYDFSIDPEMGDYGHKFPAKLITIFSRQNKNVDGAIRETLKCRSRFWNITKYENQIKKILEVKNDPDLRSKSSYEERFRKAVDESFDENAFAKALSENLNNAVQGPEWEYVLCEGLKKLFPDYSIETTSNKKEKEHGSDIIIRIPGILDNTYIVAVQIKDYTDAVDNWVVDQISKANEYFQSIQNEDGSVLIDKYLIITNAKSSDNNALIDKANEAGVKILFDEDVKRLLSKMGRTFICEDLSY